MNGYFTIEASYIMPLVLFLYLLIVLTTLRLYSRCVISQDDYLIAMRAGRFTAGEDFYGEVIYGEASSQQWQPEAYARKRLLVKKIFYPKYKPKAEGFSLTEKKVIIYSVQMGVGPTIQKEIIRMNPVKVIQEERRHV